MMKNKTLLRAFILIAALLLVGCSVFTELRLDLADKIFGREPPNQPSELKEIKAMHVATINWSKSIGDTARYDYVAVLDAGSVYSADAEGQIVKLDAANGRELWRVDADEAISGSVGVGGGLVLAGTNRGNLLAYDVGGKLLWKSKLSSEILCAPRYHDGIVVARTGDGHIYGIDAADGSRKWVYKRSLPALSLRSSAGVVIGGGAVYAGFSGGKMAAVRADNGKLIWEATVARPKGVTEIERIADITSLPIVDGPIVYAAAYQGRVAAIDRKSGRVVWNREISSYTGMNIDDNKLFVSHAFGSVYSLDNTTGKTFWRQADLLNRRLTTPLPMGNLIAVGDLEGYIHFLNRDNGKIVARIKIDGDAVMGLTAGNTTSELLATTRGGGLYSISVK